MIINFFFYKSSYQINKKLINLKPFSLSRSRVDSIVWIANSQCHRKKHFIFKNGWKRDEEMDEREYEKGLLVQVQCIHAGAWTMTWAESFHGLRWGTKETRREKMRPRVQRSLKDVPLVLVSLNESL